MVLPTAHDTHPDGDPFEAADRLAAQGSLLSRMEARAHEQQHEEENQRATPSTGKGRGPATTGLGAGRSKRKTPSLYGSPKLPPAPAAPAAATNGSARKVEEVMIIDDEDDDSPEKAVYTKITSHVLPAVKPVSGSSGKPRSRRRSNGKSAVVEPATEQDATMADTTPNASQVETVPQEVSNPITVPAEKEGTSPIPEFSSRTVEEPDSVLIPDSTPASPLPLTVPSPVHEGTPATPEAVPQAAMSEGTPPGSPPVAGAAARAEATTSSLPLTTDAVEVIPTSTAQTKQPRARSSSPVPPPAAKKAKKAPVTIRLEIDLKSYLPAPDDESTVPEYSVADLARDAGYLVGSEEEEGSSSSESGSEDGESGSENEGETGGKKKEKKEGGEEVEGGEPEKADLMGGVENDGANGEASTSAVPVVVAPLKRRRAPAAILGRLGGYDVADPFVDDTELSLFEPQWYHRPKRDGFFVHEGVLELHSDAKTGKGRARGSKNKPKYDSEGKLVPARRRSKAEIEAAASGSVPPMASTPVPKAKASGSAATNGATSAKGKGPAVPTPVLDDNGELPSVSSVPAFGAGGVKMASPVKKKKAAGEFSPEMQVEFDMLRAEAGLESWVNKTKFPPHLRILLGNVALKAIELDEYDAGFFAILTKIFPYNLFTMKKLVKREICPMRLASYTVEQESHIKTLEDGIAATLAGQVAEHKVAHKEWETRQAEKGLTKSGDVDTPDAASEDAAVASVLGIGGSGAGSGAGDISMDVDADGVTAKPGEPANTDPEPKFKYRFSEAMRLAIYHTYRIEDEMSELIIEKQTLEKATEKEGPLKEKPFSKSLARKSLYAKLAVLWPGGLMDSNRLSREMSLTKKKVDRDLARAAQT